MKGKRKKNVYEELQRRKLEKQTNPTLKKKNESVWETTQRLCAAYQEKTGVKSPMTLKREQEEEVAKRKNHKLGPDDNDSNQENGLFAFLLNCCSSRRK